MAFKVRQIVLVGKDRRVPRFSTERWDKWGFEQLGIKCVLVNVDKKKEGKIIQEIRRYHPEFIMYYQTHGIAPEVIIRTRKGAKRTGLNTFDRPIIRGMSGVNTFVNNAKLVNFAFHTGGVPECEKAHRVMQGCEPLLGMKKPEPIHTGRPVFVGTQKSSKSRKQFCELLKKNKVDLVGHDRKDVYTRQRLFCLCHERSAVLGQVQVTDKCRALYEEPGYWSNRVYLMTGFGACLLHSYVPGIEKEFEPNKEIVLYTSLKDMQEKLYTLRTHPDQCATIGEAAFKRAQKDHTYVHRARKLIRLVEGK